MGIQPFKDKQREKEREMESEAQWWKSQLAVDIHQTLKKKVE